VNSMVKILAFIAAVVAVKYKEEDESQNSTPDCFSFRENRVPSVRRGDIGTVDTMVS
jgi:hypothetical protein